MTRAALVFVAGLALLAAAGPASAAMVEITASVSAADANDEAVVRTAIQTAVDDLVKEGLPFTPTRMVVTRAHVVSGRLYVRILVADEQDAHTFRDVSKPIPIFEPASSAPGDI
jgi:hypothetical protein